MKQHVSGFVAGLVSLAGAWGFQLGFFLLAARQIGPAGVGVYTALLAPLAIVGEFVGLGGSERLIRAIARDSQHFSRLWNSLFTVVLLTAVPMMCAYVCYVLWGVGFYEMLGVAALLGVSELVFARMSVIAEHVAIANKNNRAANIARIGLPAVRFLALIVATRLGLITSVEAVVIVMAGTSFVIGSSQALIMFRRYQWPTFGFERSEIVNGFPMALTQATRAAQGNIDRVAFSLVSDVITLAFYSIASRIAQASLFSTMAILRLTYPSFFREGDKGIAYTFALAVRILPVIVLFAALSAAAADLLAGYIPQLLGPEYSASVVYVRWLCWVVVPISASYVAADAFTGADMHHFRAFYMGGSVIFQLGLLVWLLPTMGLLGAVIAYYASALSYAAVLWLDLWRRRSLALRSLISAG